MRGFALVVCVALAGCGGAQRLAAAHDAECKQLGAVPGTPAYVNCRLMKEKMDRDQNNAVLMSR